MKYHINVAIVLDMMQKFSSIKVQSKIDSFAVKLEALEIHIAQRREKRKEGNISFHCKKTMTDQKKSFGYSTCTMDGRLCFSGQVLVTQLGENFNQQNPQYFRLEHLAQAQEFHQ